MKEGSADDRMQSAKVAISSFDNQPALMHTHPMSKPGHPLASLPAILGMVFAGLALAGLALHRRTTANQPAASLAPLAAPPGSSPPPTPAAVVPPAAPPAPLAGPPAAGPASTPPSATAAMPASLAGPPASGPLPLPPPVTYNPALLATAPAMIDGYALLGFDRLAGFPFAPVPFDPATAKPGAPPPSSADQIPATIKRFDHQLAIVTGFMLPTKMEKGLVTEFLLVRSPMMCCYGQVPNMNEWVVVQVPAGVKPLMDIPVSCFGKLHVKEEFDNGYITSIYQLDGEKLTDAKG
jgi:hypothetical protein